MSIRHFLFGSSGRAIRFHFWMGQVGVIAFLIDLFGNCGTHVDGVNQDGSDTARSHRCPWA